MQGKVKNNRKMQCPVCKGQGKISEDSNEYMFETREPQTNVCLICAGTGLVGARKLLPDGKMVYQVAAEQAPGSDHIAKSSKKIKGLDSRLRGNDNRGSGNDKRESVPEVDCEQARLRLEALKAAMEPEERISVNIMMINVRGTSKKCAELTTNLAKLMAE